MINLSQSKILSNDFAKYFSSKDPSVFTGFFSDISTLTDEQKMECVNCMAAVVNQQEALPQMSLSAMTVCTTIHWNGLKIHPTFFSKIHVFWLNLHYYII